MSKERVLIATINGTEIYAVNHEGETYVPIRPICTAIGIESAPQRIKLAEDEFLSPTTTIIVSVAADGKKVTPLCQQLWASRPQLGQTAKKSDPILSATKVFCTSVGADGRGVFPTFF